VLLRGRLKRDEYVGYVVAQLPAAIVAALVIVVLGYAPRIHLAANLAGGAESAVDASRRGRPADLALWNALRPAPPVGFEPTTCGLEVADLQGVWLHSGEFTPSEFL
jgi:hypothetical protein